MEFIIGKNGSDAVRVDLPRLLETRLLIQSNSGGGKSFTVRRLLEQTAADVQQLVIDPEGEFATLREKFDYVICAPHDADAVATPQTAALLARRLLAAGVSAIIDIYDLKAHDRHAFVRKFLDALINAPRKLWHPVLVVLDEAHVFCPQTGKAESMGAVIDLATRGRKRGQCLVAATQRLSKLHKDVAAELLNKLVGRTGLDVDVKRAADELGMSSRDAVEALRNLAPGEFYGFGPAVSDCVQRFKVGPVQTTHPQSGQRLMAAPPPASNAILQQLAKLGELPQEAAREAQTIEELRTDVKRLSGQLVRAEKRVKQAGLPESEVVKREAAAAKAALQQAHAAHALTDDRALLDALTQIRHIANRATSRRTPYADLSAKPPNSAHVKSNGTGKLKSGAVRILRELVARQPAGYTRSQVATLTRFAVRGGTFTGYLSNLRRGGFIDERDDLIFASAAGVTHVGGDTPATPTTHAEVMQQWRGALKAGAHRMLENIVAAGAVGITRPALAGAVEMTASGGTFTGYLSNLRRNSLIVERRGSITAADILFPETLP